MTTESKYVIVDLQDGFKCEGYLISVNKEKMEIILSNVRKYKLDNNTVSQESKHSELSIPKIQIKEVKMVQCENDAGASQPTNTNPTTSNTGGTTSETTSVTTSGGTTNNPTTITTNTIPTTTNTIPTTTTTTTKETEILNPNAIPKKLEQNIKKSYEKDNFFDILNTISNKDSKAETIKYNEKNFETFNITETSSDYKKYSSGNYRGGRGRGGYNKFQKRGGKNSY